MVNKDDIYIGTTTKLERNVSVVGTGHGTLVSWADVLVKYEKQILKIWRDIVSYLWECLSGALAECERPHSTHLLNAPTTSLWCCWTKCAGIKLYSLIITATTTDIELAMEPESKLFPHCHVPVLMHTEHFHCRIWNTTDVSGIASLCQRFSHFARWVEKHVFLPQWVPV